MPDTQPKVQLHPVGGIPIIAVQVLLPMALSMVAGYGAVKYTQGQTEQHLQEVDRRSAYSQVEIDRVRQNAVSREELKIFIDSMRGDLQDIKTEIRAMRQERR
jgi:hypothetical protein